MNRISIAIAATVLAFAPGMAAAQHAAGHAHTFATAKDLKWNVF